MTWHMPTTNHTTLPTLTSNFIAKNSKLNVYITDGVSINVFVGHIYLSYLKSPPYPSASIQPPNIKLLPKMLHRFQSRKVFIYTYYRYTRKKVPELLPRITSTGKIKKLTTWNRIQIPFFPFCLLCTSMNVISLHNSSDMFGRKQIAHTKYTPIKSKEKNKQNSKTTSKKKLLFFLFSLSTLDFINYSTSPGFGCWAWEMYRIL